MATPEEQARDLGARLARLLGLMEEAPRWRDKPLSAAIAHYTRGMSRADRGAVSTMALEFVVEWGTMPDSKVLTPLSDAELAELPPLGYALDWAAYAVGMVVADKLAAAATNDVPAAAIHHAA